MARFACMHHVKNVPADLGGYSPEFIDISHERASVGMRSKVLNAEIFAEFCFPHF
jgi:hypothetical protein